MDKDRIKLINWFFEFAYCDIQKMTSAEFSKIFIECSTIRTSSSLPQDSGMAGGMAFSHEALEKQALTEHQAWFKDRLSELMTVIENLDHYKVTKWISDKFKEGFGKINFNEPAFAHISDVQVVNFVNPSFEVDARVKVPLEYKSNETIQARWKKTWKKESIISVNLYASGDLRHVLFVEFLRAVNQIPIEYFRKCAECQHWFFHISKREKQYCSNLCAARKANRDRRSRDKINKPDDYKEELKASSKRARKSYENKMKGQGYKKIERRPRKYKD